MPVAVAAALLPDADMPGTAGRRVALGIALAAIAALLVVRDGELRRALWIVCALSGAYPVLGALTGHRGATHSLLALAAGALAMRAVFPEALAAFALGYASHIAADFLTAEGVPLLWPLHGRRYSAGLFRTGGVGEKIVAACALAASAWKYLEGF